jgi:hypothetical protein
MRDSRIAAIYEGANGVQAVDLVQRKLPLSAGATVAREIAAMREVAAKVAASGDAGFGGSAGLLTRSIDSLERATALIHQALASRPVDALAGATPYLRLFGLTIGGTCLAKAGLAAQNLARGGDESQMGRVALARFFAEKILPGTSGLEDAIASGAQVLEAWETALSE